MATAASIRIDGKDVPFRADESIIDAAARARVYIPRLCHRPGFAPHGSCKLCTVNVDGRLMAACTTPARAGMVVENDTPTLNDDRRALTEMLFVEGNHICPACEKTGSCDLQAVGYHLGTAALRFDHFYPPRDLDASHPDVVLDRNRCILCALCVRASREIDGKDVFAIAGRGLQSRIVVNSTSGRLADTNLSVDDAAVNVCPVGAILVKRQAFRVPIGERKYDVYPIAVIATNAAAKSEADGNA
jgi:[NiFe] hydrogenase diaphorase moiety small subunit